MKRILEVLGSIRDTAIFVIYDNTSASDLMKEERIALMDEYRQKEETARAQKEAKDKALRAAGEAYMETEEYIYAGRFEKIRITMIYGIFLNNVGEYTFKTGKNTYIVNEIFPEKGKTLEQALADLILYEIDNGGISDKKKDKTEKENPKK